MHLLQDSLMDQLRFPSIRRILYLHKVIVKKIRTVSRTDEVFEFVKAAKDHLQTIRHGKRQHPDSLIGTNLKAEMVIASTYSKKSKESGTDEQLFLATLDQNNKVGEDSKRLLRIPASEDLQKFESGKEPNGKWRKKMITKLLI